MHVASLREILEMNGMECLLSICDGCLSVILL